VPSSRFDELWDDQRRRAVSRIVQGSQIFIHRTAGSFGIDIYSEPGIIASATQSSPVIASICAPSVEAAWSRSAFGRARRDAQHRAVTEGSTSAHLATQQLLIVIVIFARLLPVLMQIQQSAQSVWQMLPVFDDLCGLIARCEAAREPLEAGGKERLPLRDKIELSGVRFRYGKERGPDVLQGVIAEFA
jgi:hypothetical protein